MTRIPLVSGAYQARSIIAGAQRCVNLYPESNPADSQLPVPVTHYPTPGLRRLVQIVLVAPVRSVYRATNGDLYAVVGPQVYFIDANLKATLVGQIADGATPVSFSDNGLVILIVDGSPNGYCIDMTSGARTFGAVEDPNFYGADKVDYLDTFFILNRPGTTQFYISLSEVTFSMLTSPVAGTAFDSLDIAAKTGSSDNIVSLIVSAGQILLIGALASEVWVNTGESDFTFGRLPGALIEHGCVAKYSVAKADIAAFWLSSDREGQGIVVKAEGVQLARISTHAIEADFQAYPKITDAIGFTFQQQGHAFYVLAFPSANKTWAFEIQTEQWHELVYTDQNGAPNRHRANCCCAAYGMNIVGDWQSGRLYALDPNVFEDDGRPIVRIRTFPHLVNDGKRIAYTSFIADMQVGTLAGKTLDAPPEVSLRWSDTRGASYGNPVKQAIGSAGDYLRSILWRRLGMARDRVFELSWSVPVPTALNGAFIESEERAT